MTPPKLGPTAAEIVGALVPLLQEVARKEDVQALTAELHELNGTVKDLCVWRGGVNVRHAQEDKQPPTEKPAPPEITASPTIALLNLVLAWIFRFMLAGAALAAGLNLAKLAELVK